MKTAKEFRAESEEIRRIIPVYASTFIEQLLNALEEVEKDRDTFKFAVCVHQKSTEEKDEELRIGNKLCADLTDKCRDLEAELEGVYASRDHYRTANQKLVEENQKLKEEKADWIDSFNQLESLLGEGPLFTLDEVEEAIGKLKIQSVIQIGWSEEEVIEVLAQDILSNLKSKHTSDSDKEEEDIIDRMSGEPEGHRTGKIEK